MKLQIVPASRGIQWVKLGVQTFFRQPLALSGLFFMVFAALAAIRILPFIGVVLAPLLLPGAILGLMAATKEAHNGKFPLPAVLLCAFRAGRPQVRSMLVLGALYGLGMVALLLTTILIDDGNLAAAALLGNTPSEEKMQERPFQIATFVVSAFNFPWLLLFGHAAALVHWHGLPPVKSLFFSAATMVRNFGAYLIYGLVWIGVFEGFGIIVQSLAALLGGTDGMPVAFVPLVLLLLASVFTSIYFTFLDSFAITPGADT